MRSLDIMGFVPDVDVDPGNGIAYSEIDEVVVANLVVIRAEASIDLGPLLSLRVVQCQLTRAVAQREKLTKLVRPRSAEWRLFLVIAAAYPGSVSFTAFLSPDPAAAVINKLTRELGINRSGTDDKSKAFGTLLDKVSQLHQATIPFPAPGEASGWVADSSSDPLVITWDPNAAQPVNVDGRAAAPTGVAGMGSHTTAWKLEVRAINVIAKTAIARTAEAKHVDEAVMSALADAIDVDLVSSLMDLAPVLPVDQVAAGQLADLFDAATDATNAEDVVSAAQSFLEFRNLLPFATVDAGGRGGKGEGTTDTKKGLFDSESLEEEAGLVETALKTLQGRKDAAESLLGAADLLEEKLRASSATVDTSEPEGWSTVASVSQAAQNTAKRLRDRATALLKAPPTGVPAVAFVADTIIHARMAEHDRVWLEVNHG